MIITIADIRRAGHCRAGARRWFEAHGLDFAAFLKHGIDEEDFIARGDALAARVVDLKRKRDEQV